MKATAMKHLRMFSLQVFLAVFLVSLGCSSGTTGPQRYDLSGEVTYAGKPVPFGRIDFLPDIARGNSGPAGFAEIRGGKFNTARTGKGILGGAYSVVISGYKTEFQPQSVSDEELAAGPNTDQILFRDYKTSVEFLKETATRDFQVPQSAGKPPSLLQK